MHRPLNGSIQIHLFHSNDKYSRKRLFPSTVLSISLKESTEP